MKELIMIFTMQLLFINNGIVYSQATQEWNSRYGKTGIDVANSIATDNFGNVYVTGTVTDPFSNYDIVTIKYSQSGKQLWLSKYNGPANGSDAAFKIKLDSKGNVIVTGKSEGVGTNFDFITIKYSSSGEQKWSSRYNSPENRYDEAGNINIDSLDNIYITGYSSWNYVIIKYDSLGNQIWVSSYGNINYIDVPHATVLDKLGNIFITGDSSIDTATSRDIATIKYNSDGILQWAARFNSTYNENEYGKDLGVDNDGNIYVCGGSQGDLFYDDYIIVKYDSSGIEQWNRRYNGSANFLDQARYLVIDNSNNIYITGYSTHTGTGYDYTTIKYNTNGDQLWISRYNNGLNDVPNHMIIDSYGNLYVTGMSDGSGTGKDYATVKYDSAGNQLWVIRFDYSGQYGDIPYAIDVDNNGSVYVTGESDRDILTIKYSQLTGVNPISFGTPSEYKLEQNYPNPFNPATVISYELKVTERAKLIVYDILGNEIATLVDESKPAGSYEIVFDGSDFPSGIYFYFLRV
ncbi:MAG: SBBP repeat-containing protein, partial [Ignavibacteriae bacterium]|nr:SBBP repeat-containing protein [Ignavibacteriota bacterium]